MRYFISLAMCLCVASSAFAGVTERTWDVDARPRTALVCTPDDASKKPAAGWPLVFVFHGHGGSAAQIRKQFRTDTLWPDAVVVYPQGLPTVGQITDPKGERNGWDSLTPPEQNRDVRFFDVALKALLADSAVDAGRVFSTGHSNGGGFTYTLWAHRPAALAAVAPSSAVIAAKDAGKLTPKPALMLAGERDPLVRFAWQRRMIDAVKTLDGVTGDGRPWGRDGTFYDSPTTPVATIIYDGGHAPPPGAGERIVEFFKTVSPGENTKK